ncbi:hypothetical protein BS17DRAFT_205128 [Gyrodon lividus]|nr:hypothetical protein BS17DRAFT_205128 [Gyrodon lividus]
MTHPTQDDDHLSLFAAGALSAPVVIVPPVLALKVATFLSAILPNVTLIKYIPLRSWSTCEGIAELRLLQYHDEWRLVQDSYEFFVAARRSGGGDVTLRIWISRRALSSLFISWAVVSYR